MKAVLDVWMPVVPENEARAILKTAIIPKLGAAVTRWNPTEDTVPIHCWILPWHEYAGKLKNIFLWNYCILLLIFLHIFS